MLSQVVQSLYSRCSKRSSQELPEKSCNISPTGRNMFDQPDDICFVQCIFTCRHKSCGHVKFLKINLLCTFKHKAVITLSVHTRQGAVACEAAKIQGQILGSMNTDYKDSCSLSLFLKLCNLQNIDCLDLVLGSHFYGSN